MRGDHVMSSHSMSVLILVEQFGQMNIHTRNLLEKFNIYYSLKTKTNQFRIEWEWI